MTKVAFRAQTGSHEYNLDVENSDRDYITYAFPTFEDLYNRNLLNDSKITVVEDNTLHDVRKLGSMLTKSSTNAIQVLFSNEVEAEGDGARLYTELVLIREDIARMNLPRLFDTSMGMFNEEKKRYQRHLSNGDTLKAGKAAASAIRIALFTFNYASQDFTDFKKAIWFEDNSPLRHLLRDLKSGDHTLGNVDKMLAAYERAAVNTKPLYKHSTKNEDTEAKVNEIVRRYVREQIKLELGGE